MKKLILMITLLVSIASQANTGSSPAELPAAALYLTSSILILAEQVVLERGTDGLLNADTEGYVDDVVLLEALDIIREVKADKAENMTDVQVIKLI